jgi:Ca2+-binding EF-hand superfamily protein
MHVRSVQQLIGAVACTTVFVFAADAAIAGQGRGSGRFNGLDRDGDGVITRSEWRGNDRSFQNHDWNRDGVLSGDEVRSALVSADPRDQRSWEGATDWTEDRFSTLDRNRDGRLSESEWNADRWLFSRIDANGDRVVSRREFLGLEYDASEPWTLPGRDDTDREDVPDRFEQVDRNDDGVITMNEWPRSENAFRRRDVDRSGAIERDELPAAGQRQGTAYETGYERGLLDGRKAGLEDKNRRNRWDLDGQRELESADAGYASAMGSRQEYQAGYRAGFRVGYGEGFGPR